MHSVRLIPVVSGSIKAKQSVVKHAQTSVVHRTLHRSQIAIVMSHLVGICSVVHHRHKGCVRLIELLLLHEAVDYRIHVKPRYKLACHHCWFRVVVVGERFIEPRYVATLSRGSDAFSDVEAAW
jgi:hypothetical protein